MKLKTEQIENIKYLYKIKKYNYREIAEKYGVAIDTIRYHVKEESKEYKKNRAKIVRDRLTKEEKEEIKIKNRDYQKEYHKRRYQTDADYREKQIIYSTNWRLKNK